MNKGSNVTGMRAHGAKSSGPQMSIVGISNAGPSHGSSYPPRATQAGRNSSIFANDNSPLMPATNGSGAKAPVNSSLLGR